MNTTTRTICAILCIAVITLCAVMITGRIFGHTRFCDLTEFNLYSLSQGTKSIISKINQPITLKLYYSRVASRKGPEQIRFWNNYYLYVRDLLEEYAGLSGGRLKLEVIDPRPFSPEEDEALRFGIQRFQLSEEESFFFGLAAVTELGREKVIKFFEPNRQEFVEYDISKMISELLQRERKKVGILSFLPVTGSDMSPYLMQMLRMQGKTPEKP
ncbi:MAG: GldG family protein, partial [Candidatus Wallbacteria bacterium]|nr:GldG family protein [Candidatus Wallbacteria bacterium]